jgi:hypothetical protein
VRHGAVHERRRAFRAPLEEITLAIDHSHAPAGMRSPEPAARQVPAMEDVAAQLLAAAHACSPLALFDQKLATDLAEGDALALLKNAADLLVRNKLAKFADEGRTEIAITNAGRYWALNGGFMAFLKEDPPGGGGGGGRGRNPEMEALRSEYMRLRLNTFWWTFGMSAAGLVFSVISIFIAVLLGQRTLP